MSTNDPFEGPAWEGAGLTTATAPERSRRRMSAQTRNRWRRRRFAGYLILGCLALLVAAAVWVVVTALLARSELDRIRAEIGQLKFQVTSGDLNGARATADALEQHAHHAHDLTTGPAWAAAAWLPGIGDPLRTIRGITANADLLASTTVPDLVTVSHQVDPKTIRISGDTYDVSGVVKAAPLVTEAVTSAQDVQRRIVALPAHTWIPAVDRGRDELVGKLADLNATLTSVNRATQVLPTMLGFDGPKRYFIGFENDAEARGLGGLPGAFAIVVADHGRISFTHMEQDSALNGVPSNADLSPAYAQAYGTIGTENYLNSTITPNFPWVGQIWAGMWHTKSGEKVDGAIAVDPTAMSYLLAVTGPASLPNGQVVSAANVVSLTQSTAYKDFGSNVAGRKQYLLDIAQAVQKRVLSGSGEVSALVKAADRAAIERRLLVWSSDPAAEAQLQQTPLGGQVPTGDAPFTGFTVTNAGGNKLDYYLDRRISYSRSGCGATRDVTVTVTLTNNAPASGLPDYVTNRSDDPPYPVKPGDNKLIVTVYATAGATIDAATLDGQPLGVFGSALLSHPMWTSNIEVPRGTSRTLTYQLTEPPGAGPLYVLRQPLVRPLQETVDVEPCQR